MSTPHLTCLLMTVYITEKLPPHQMWCWACLLHILPVCWWLSTLQRSFLHIKWDAEHVYSTSYLFADDCLHYREASSKSNVMLSMSTPHLTCLLMTVYITEKLPPHQMWCWAGLLHILHVCCWLSTLQRSFLHIKCYAEHVYSTSYLFADESILYIEASSTSNVMLSMLADDCLLYREASSTSNVMLSMPTPHLTCLLMTVCSTEKLPPHQMWCWACLLHILPVCWWLSTLQNNPFTTSNVMLENLKTISKRRPYVKIPKNAQQTKHYIMQTKLSRDTGHYNYTLPNHTLHLIFTHPYLGFHLEKNNG